MARHTHLQLNIKQTMSHGFIEADVKHAFALAPDTIVFNEAVAVTHAVIRSEAARLGYGVFIPSGSASQVVLVWKKSVFSASYRTVALAMKGRKHVSPSRYVVRVRLLHLATGRHLNLVGTHMVSSGWTGSKWLDAWRQRGWYAHAAVLGTVLRWTYRHNDAVLWSGDCNRPPYTFADKKPFSALNIKGAATSEILHSDATHGRITFDYIGVYSRHIKFRVVSVTTPAFHSDHDGVLAVLEW